MLSLVNSLSSYTSGAMSGFSQQRSSTTAQFGNQFQQIEANSDSLLFNAYGSDPTQGLGTLNAYR